MRRTIAILTGCLLLVSASLWVMARTRDAQAAIPHPAQPQAPAATPPPPVPVEAAVPARAPEPTKAPMAAGAKAPDFVNAPPVLKAGLPAQTAPRSLPPTPPPAEAASSNVQQSNDAYNIWANDFRRRTYENQLIQTRIIFVLVLALVFAGLFFSWLQFQHSFHLKQVLRKHVAAKVDEAAAATPAQDEFAFGKDGVVIKSAYLGVIILTISMAFFFLYLVYVYPIT